MELRWDDLAVLLAIGREGTLSGAAKHLLVNHTTVSRRLAAAEAAMQTRLFDRTPSGYVATSAGEQVLAVATRVEEQIQSLDRAVLGQDTQLSGPLRVTTVDILATLHADAFRTFTERYPKVELELSVDNRARSLSKREADVALRLTNRPPEHLFGRRLGRFEFAVYGARKLVEDLGPKADLGDYPWMGWDEASGATMTAAWMRKHVPDASVVCRVDSVLVMLEMVKRGAGIQFLACALGDREPDLVRLRDVEANFGMDLWLLTHPDLKGTARVRALMEHLGETLRPWYSRWAGQRPAA